MAILVNESIVSVNRSSMIAAIKDDDPIDDPINDPIDILRKRDVIFFVLEDSSSMERIDLLDDMPGSQGGI